MPADQTDSSTHPEPEPTEYDFPGFYKAGAGCWVVNDDRARRLGLVVRRDGRWVAECDHGCDGFLPRRERETAHGDLLNHWAEANGRSGGDDAR